MRGLDPRICSGKEDGRVKHGHDGIGFESIDTTALIFNKCIK
jgi:hypothetical protein